MNSVYDRALIEIGSEGCFQKKYDFIINIAFSAVWSMIYVHMIVVLVVVPYTCKLPEKTINVSDETWKLKYIPHEIIHEEIKFESCLIYISPGENNLTRSCTEYEYDKTWYDSTVSTDNDWVCDKEIYIPNILAYSKIMELFGSMFFGWIGDVYGRRITYITAIVLAMIGRITSLLANSSYIVFLLGCLISSFALWSAMQSVSVISVEITSPERRSIITSMRSVSGSIGIVIMSLVYWWLKEWKIFIIATTAPLIVFILFSCYMIESPRWQHANTKTKQCVEQLKRIAKANGKSLKSETEKELLSYIPQSAVKSLGPLSLFSRPKLAFNAIFHLIMWTVGSTCYTMQVLSIGQRPNGNPYLELCWQTLSEIPASCFTGWLANHIGRRYSGAGSFFIISVAWLLIAFRDISSSSWVRIWWIGTILNIMIRVSNAVIYIVANLLALELYPTPLRQSGMALGNVFSSLGSVIAPYILFLTRKIDERLPGMIISGMSLCAVFATLMLPETSNIKLPETIEEAESLSRKTQYVSVPLENIDTQEKSNCDKLLAS